MVMFRPTYNYENNEVRRKDSPSPTAPYDTIPDLPPPDAAFPNLFENLPSSPYGKPGGFFGSFNTKEKDFSATPNSYSSKSQATKGISMSIDISLKNISVLIKLIFCRESGESDNVQAKTVVHNHNHCPAHLL